jgi:hypothetical protein
MASFQLPVVKEPQIVHEFEYRDTLVRFSVSTHRGRTYMDVRAYWQPEPGGPWVPTKKGLRHNVEALEDWQAGIAAIAEAIDGTDTRSSTQEAA